jgi:hypothetical protein
MDIQDLDEQLQFDQFDAVREDDDGDFLLGDDNPLHELQGPTPTRSDDKRMDFGGNLYDQEPDEQIEEFEIDDRDDLDASIPVPN